jgi:anti-sigma-K factor RskA
MTAPDLHTLTGAYAADALTLEERQAFEQHLAECEACRHEVAELTTTAARLAVGAATAPPPSLRARVMAEVAATAQLPAEVSPRAGERTGTPAPTTLESRRQADAGSSPPWYRQPFAIAAAVLLVVSLALGGLLVRTQQQADQSRSDAQRFEAIIENPSHVVVGRPVTDGGRATVIAADGQAVFLARNLPALPSGRAYQLWVLDSAGARSAGVLSPSAGGRVEHFVSGVGTGDSLGLTVEPSGGSDQPTTDPIWVAPTSA